MSGKNIIESISQVSKDFTDEIKSEPVFVTAALMQMSQFGGTDAESTKAAIDHTFKEGDLKINDYGTKLISSTADGASVNFGAYNGMLKKLEEDGRPWLVKIHCVNHRTELAVKDTFENSRFQRVDKFYIGLYNLLKNSGAIKSNIKSAATTLGISVYTLPKMTGTRFVSHRKKALTNLLNMWPAVITALENSLVIRTHKADTKAKIQGQLKELRSYSFLCLVCAYLDILEKVTQTSLVFEGEGLLPYEVMPTVQITINELEDLIECSGTEEELLDSHLARFQFVENEDGTKTLSSAFVKNNNMLKKLENREYITIALERFTELTNDAMLSASRIKKELATELIPFLQNRFKSFNDSVFEQMKWFDPKSWTGNTTDEINDIKALAEYFEAPLRKTAYDGKHIAGEWKRFQSFVNINFGSKLQSNSIDAKAIWKNVIKYRRDQFPNLCVMASIIYVLSPSNSCVERSFSTLTTLLTDRRLSTKHDTVEKIIRIHGNDKIWNEKEREDIIERAVEIHLQKRRRKQMDNENPSKRKRLSSMQETEVQIIDYSESDGDSSEEEDNREEAEVENIESMDV